MTTRDMLIKQHSFIQQAVLTHHDQKMHKTELPSLTEAGFFRSVHDFVTFSGGDHSIQKILIANNGIGATKAIRSIRRWAFETFGDERAVCANIHTERPADNILMLWFKCIHQIQFVVMATPEDMRANAEYIRLADQLVDVPGGSNNNNYANINLICQIAEQLQVDAVMRMWGHASENPALPNSLLKLNRRVCYAALTTATLTQLEWCMTALTNDYHRRSLACMYCTV